MPECPHCGDDYDWETYSRHVSEWCQDRPPEGQQTLEEVAH
ncbi:hypothetical protein [Haloarcula argentinensis]|nr:hypothetical protein [Haloarcula argentinensis]